MQPFISKGQEKSNWWQRYRFILVILIKNMKYFYHILTFLI